MDEDSLRNIETLRESLAELNRARQRERALRHETEALLQGLHIMNGAKDRDTLFDQLARILRTLIPFDDGLLLEWEDPGYRVTRSSNAAYQEAFWPICPLLQRVSKGEAVTFFDARLSPDWQDAVPDNLKTAKSVIIAPFQSENIFAIMVFLHPQRAHFTKAHFNLLQRFTPLINQALTSVEFYEKQKRDQELVQQATMARLTAAEERRKADKEVRRIRDLMASAISFAPIYLWELDVNGFYTFVEGCDKVLGIPPEELIGQDAHLYVDQLDPDHNHRWHKAFDAREPFTNLVIERPRRDGGRLWVSISGSPFYNEQGVFCGYRGVTTDVSDAMRANMKLAEMALHDALTGLANRRKFLDYFDTSVARVRRYRKPMSLLALDLDHFKRVNDAYGHPAGDDVLIAVANVLQGMVRKTDLAARFGGEEFMVLLPETSREGAMEVAEKIRATLEAETISAQCNESRVLLNITISIGVATMAPDGDLASFDDLMERADQALYAAKMSGRNRVCVEPEHTPVEDDSGDTELS